MSAKQQAVRVELPMPEVPDRLQNYEQADEEVYRLMERIIRKHPRHVGFLAGVPIKILFSTKRRISKGKRVLGSAKTYSGADLLVHPYRGLIVLDLFYWQDNPEKQEPLLFHEMCHFALDEESGELTTQTHDIEEFYAVLQEYGDWKSDLKPLQHVQMNLFSEESNLVGLKPKS